MSAKWAKYQKAKKAILAKHGVTAAEWHVLDIVRLKVPLGPDDLARFLVGYLDGLPDAKFTALEFRIAMDSLVDKGLLCVLGFADAVSPAPPYSTWDDDMIDGLEGKLDFTPAGFAIMKEISVA